MVNEELYLLVLDDWPPPFGKETARPGCVRLADACPVPDRIAGERTQREENCAGPAAGFKTNADGEQDDDAETMAKESTLTLTLKRFPNESSLLGFIPFRHLTVI